MDPDPLNSSHFFISQVVVLLKVEPALFSILLLCFLFFFVLTFIVSGAEVAYFSLSQNDLEKIKKLKTSSAKNIIKDLKHPNNLLGAILITNAFCALTTILILNWIIDISFHKAQNGVVFETLKITFEIFFLIFFAELIPKLLASSRNLLFALKVSFTIHYLHKILFKITMPLAKLSKILLNQNKVNRDPLKIRDIQDAIDVAAVNVGSDGQEVQMLKGVVELVHSHVKDIMINRRDMFFLEKNMSYKTMMTKVKQSDFSRMPVINESIDYIAGILYIKDLLNAQNKPKNYNWTKHLREPLYIHEETKLNELLKLFQASQKHMAIAIDEYGGTMGLVTLEDVLEEIVGEIHDEYDKEKKIGEKIDDNTFVFDGKTNLSDAIKMMNIDMNIIEKYKENVSSIAGLVLEITGRIPKQSETIKSQNFIIQVLSKRKNTLEKIKITLVRENK